MSTVPSATAGSLAAPLPQRPRKLDDHAPSSGGRLLPQTSRASTVTRWLFAALIILSVAGGTWWSQRGGDPTPTPETAAVIPNFSASPVGTPDPSTLCSNLPDPYYNCPSAMDIVSVSYVVTGGFEAGDYQMQLQSWSLQANASLANQLLETATGAVVDFVTDGTYSATFSEPVRVGKKGYQGTRFSTIEPGQPVELVSGDSVTYPLGSLVELRNPLTSREVEFKRGVIYRGEISNEEFPADGVHMKVEGDSTLSGQAIANHPELSLMLTYVQFIPGVEYAPSQLTSIGPVDPRGMSKADGGFFLVITEAQG